MPKNKKSKLVVYLDKLEQEYMAAIVKKTGKTSKDVVKLALASLHEKLLSSQGSGNSPENVVIHGQLLTQKSLSNGPHADPFIIMDKAKTIF